MNTTAGRIVSGMSASVIALVAGFDAAAAPASTATPGAAAAMQSALDLFGAIPIDPTVGITGGAVAFGLSGLLFAMRSFRESRQSTAHWTRRLARMEAKLEISDSILASHPGLVLVWDDTPEQVTDGWGTPRVLGGPAALASLLAFSGEDLENFDNPAASLLTVLGDLPLEGEEGRATAPSLREKVQSLRAHGIAFSGSVVTDEGRPIECDGRVAGNQVVLWLTDPVVRLAEEAGVVGAVRDRAADLHGALTQLDRAPLVAWRRGPDLTLECVYPSNVELVEAINLAEVIEAQIEIDPAFRKIAEEAKEEAERRGARAKDGFVTVSAKGQRRRLRVIEMPMHGSGGASFGGIAIDVTQQERLSEDLNRQRSAHRKTLDQLSAAVAVFDGAQHLEYYNEAFAALWGFTESDLRARPSHGDLLDQLRHRGALQAHSDFGAWKAGQLRLYTEEAGDTGSAQDGSIPDEIWNLPSAKILKVSQQRHSLGGVSVVFEDITENLDLQSRYTTQISVQRETLNSIHQGVAVFGSDGRLALHNRAFESLWSLSRDILQDRPHWNVLQGEMARRSEGSGKELGALKHHIVSFAPEDRVPHAGEQLSLTDGRYLLSATAPLPDGATLVTFLDVTDAREREKDLEARNQLLEDTDRIKTRFVDHISYQLRNPLNTIIGFTQMLEEGFVGSLNDQQRDYAAMILQASNTLMDLVNDIIDLAAIDAGRLSLDIGEMDVRQLLESAATFAMLKAEDSQIELTVDCPKDIGTLQADERRLKQVLFNLLANAFSFTDAGGNVVMGARREGDAMRLWVEDTGRGVSPDDQATVFDRFESSGPGAGAGLGLSLVNSFIALHGGFTRLASQEGAGTCVTLHLPLGGPNAALPGAREDTVSSVAAMLLAEEEDEAAADRAVARAVKKVSAAE